MMTSDDVTDGDASHESMAVAIPVFAGAVLAVQLMVTFGGQVRTGGVMSSTTIV